MPNLNCPVCNAPFDRDRVEDHLAESHSDPAVQFHGRPVAVVIREFAAGGNDDNAEVQADLTTVPTPSALEAIGIRIDDMRHVDVTTETGATLTPPEAKRLFEAVEAYAGYRVDRASFVVNFVDWGIRNGFAEELSEAGGFSLVEHSTAGRRTTYVKVSALHAAINDNFAGSGNGRSFTFRRFGRYLGRSIPTIVETNADLSKFYVDGSPMSNRLGVPASDFLAVTSIFEYIKPFQKWSTAERKAWEAHNRSVVKLANEASAEFMPSDLRPSPSQAQTVIDAGYGDFHRRHVGASRHDSIPYGQGKSIFEKMANRPASAGREGLGF